MQIHLLFIVPLQVSRAEPLGGSALADYLLSSFLERYVLRLRGIFGFELDFFRKVVTESLITVCR